jgi:phage-related protein
MMMIAMQSVPVPDPGQDPWPWVASLAVAALGFIFLRYDSAKDARIKRSEEREDRLLEQNQAASAILKEQTAATLKAAQIAEQAFERGKATIEKILERLDRSDAEGPPPTQRRRG